MEKKNTHTHTQPVKQGLHRSTYSPTDEVSQLSYVPNIFASSFHPRTLFRSPPPLPRLQCVPSILPREDFNPSFPLLPTLYAMPATDALSAVDTVGFALTESNSRVPQTTRGEGGGRRSTLDHNWHRPTIPTSSKSSKAEPTIALVRGGIYMVYPYCTVLYR